MDIIKILNTDHITLDIQATNKAEAIEELTNPLKKDGATDRRETFIKDVWQCEAKGLIDFENHTATPHGKFSAVINITLVIGRTCQDISWETLDGSSVRCIILSAARLGDQNATHVCLPSQVADTPADDNTIEQLLVETSP